MFVVTRCISRCAESQPWQQTGRAARLRVAPCQLRPLSTSPPVNFAFCDSLSLPCRDIWHQQLLSSAAPPPHGGVGHAADAGEFTTEAQRRAWAEQAGVLGGMGGEGTKSMRMRIRTARSGHTPNKGRTQQTRDSMQNMFQVSPHPHREQTETLFSKCAGNFQHVSSTTSAFGAGDRNLFSL